jgi:tetratricopeptide (TPR) repeat protein
MPFHHTLSAPRGLALLAFVVLTLGAAEGSGQEADEAPAISSTDEEARGLFERGNASYARGEYAEAKQLFEAAHHLSKRPQLLYNVALADDHLRNDAEALRSYRSFLEALPETPNAEEVRARIRALEEALAGRAPAPAQAVADPEQAARSVMEPTAERAPTQASPARPLVRRWWVWTTAAVLLAGSAVGIALATRAGGSSERPLPGDNGLVVHALVQP